jgi:hypothetical protein
MPRINDKEIMPTFTVRLKKSTREAISVVAELHQLDSSDIFRRYIKEGLEREIEALLRKNKVAAEDGAKIRELIEG